MVYFHLHIVLITYPQLWLKLDSTLMWYALFEFGKIFGCTSVTDIFPWTLNSQKSFWFIGDGCGLWIGGLFYLSSKLYIKRSFFHIHQEKLIAINFLIIICLQNQWKTVNFWLKLSVGPNLLNQFSSGVHLSSLHYPWW